MYSKAYTILRWGYKDSYKTAMVVAVPDKATVYSLRSSFSLLVLPDSLILIQLLQSYVLPSLLHKWETAVHHHTTISVQIHLLNMAVCGEVYISP